MSELTTTYQDMKIQIGQQISQLFQNLIDHESRTKNAPDDPFLVGDLRDIYNKITQINNLFSHKYGNSYDSLISFLENHYESLLVQNFKSSYSPKQQQFVIDIVNSDFSERLRHYDGRFFVSGPGVYAEDYSEIDEITRLTSSPILRDSLGLGFILYCSH